MSKTKKMLRNGYLDDFVLWVWDSGGAASSSFSRDDLPVRKQLSSPDSVWLPALESPLQALGHRRAVLTDHFGLGNVFYGFTEEEGSFARFQMGTKSRRCRQRQFFVVCC